MNQGKAECRVCHHEDYILEDGLCTDCLRARGIALRGTFCTRCGREPRSMSNLSGWCETCAEENRILFSLSNRIANRENNQQRPEFYNCSFTATPTDPTAIITVQNPGLVGINTAIRSWELRAAPVQEGMTINGDMLINGSITVIGPDGREMEVVLRPKTKSITKPLPVEPETPRKSRYDLAKESGNG